MTQLEDSAAAVDQRALRAWADQLRAHYEQTDPSATTAEAQVAWPLYARVLAAEADRDPLAGA